jgi:hypothetical protein
MRLTYNDFVIDTNDVDVELHTTDNEVSDLILGVPAHYNVAYVISRGNTGTTTASFPASGGVPGVTPTLVSLQISQAGGSVGPLGEVKIWDGPIGTGTLIYDVFISSPGAPMMSSPGAVTGGLGGSVGIVQDMPLPLTPQGQRNLQATPGNQMNIQVIGTSNNNVLINARFSDGLPTAP